MLRNTYISLILLTILAVCASSAWAGPPDLTVDPATGALPYQEPTSVAKIKPTASQTYKVKSSTGFASQFDGVSRLNPMSWGFDCQLPIPAKRQFVVGPQFFFARLRGQARYNPMMTGLDSTMVDFDDHLGFRKGSHTMWSMRAHYQFQPRWGVRYSYTPFHLESSQAPLSSFTFAGHSFAGGGLSGIRSRWDRQEHRIGLLFDVKQSPNSATSLFAQYLNLQDRLAVGDGLGATDTAIWSDTKHMAMLGLEFSKCLRNHNGTTLALTGKAGVAFLDDNLGYDAEAGLNYLIPIRTGRFGFLKGGYRYFQLKKDKDSNVFSTTMDGAFVEVGYLF
ncbi:MAG: hypothetical protein V2B18_15775 [Pseudomonadota bacterium]